MGVLAVLAGFYFWGSFLEKHPERAVVGQRLRAEHATDRERMEASARERELSAALEATRWAYAESVRQARPVTSAVVAAPASARAASPVGTDAWWGQAAGRKTAPAKSLEPGVPGAASNHQGAI